MRRWINGWTVRVLAAGLLAAALPHAAHAGEGDVAPASMFAKGTWTLDLYGTYVHSFHKKDNLASGVVGGSYYFAERHAVRFEAVGYFLNNQEGESGGAAADSDDTAAGGANIGLRWHFHERGRYTFFVEGIAGLFYGLRNFPQGGTHFNFNEQVGLGATYRLDENCHLVGGLRYMHISNARIRGEDENPRFDGLGAFVGMAFTY